MSEDILEAIVETVSRELPGDVGESGQRVSEKNREEMLDLLREAADELGESPSFRAFNELDLDVSGNVIANAFGTGTRRRRGRVSKPGNGASEGPASPSTRTTPPR